MGAPRWLRPLAGVPVSAPSCVACRRSATPLTRLACRATLWRRRVAAGATGTDSSSFSANMSTGRRRRRPRRRHRRPTAPEPTPPGAASTNPDRRPHRHTDRQMSWRTDGRCTAVGSLTPPASCLMWSACSGRRVTGRCTYIDFCQLKVLWTAVILTVREIDVAVVSTSLEFSTTGSNLGTFLFFFYFKLLYTCEFHARFSIVLTRLTPVLLHNVHKHLSRYV